MQLVNNLINIYNIVSVTRKIDELATNFLLLHNDEYYAVVEIRTDIYGPIALF